MVGSKLAGRLALGDVVGDLVERVPDGEPRRDLGDREPGGLRRQRRGPADTRGFISMTTMSPVVGVHARTARSSRRSRRPTRRMQANAASRIAWYSTSVSVWAGATVIESPVCTPIGSTFSIEQMITQLSARSRMTSSSNSFHPAIDRSMRISLIGLASRPAGGDRARTPRRSTAMPVPLPPRMYAGRMTTGRPIRPTTSRASSMVWAVPDVGHRRGRSRSSPA